jgi:hypothetical protein
MEAAGLLISSACLSAGAGWLLTATLPPSPRLPRAVPAAGKDTPSGVADGPPSPMTDAEEPLVQMTPRSCIRAGIPALALGSFGLVAELKGLTHVASLTLAGVAAVLSALALADLHWHPAVYPAAQERHDDRAAEPAGESRPAGNADGAEAEESGFIRDWAAGDSVTQAAAKAAWRAMPWAARVATAMLSLVGIASIWMLAVHGHPGLWHAVAASVRWGERIDSWSNWVKIALFGPAFAVLIAIAASAVVGAVVFGASRAIVGLVGRNVRWLSEGLLFFAMGTLGSGGAILLVRLLVYAWNANQPSPA